jgi:hypothetical protein
LANGRSEQPTRYKRKKERKQLGRNADEVKESRWLKISQQKKSQVANIKTLNASKQIYDKKLRDFDFAVNQRQTEVKFDYFLITGRKLANSIPNITSRMMRRRSSPF